MSSGVPAAEGDGLDSASEVERYGHRGEPMRRVLASLLSSGYDAFERAIFCKRPVTTGCVGERAEHVVTQRFGDPGSRPGAGVLRGGVRLHSGRERRLPGVDFNLSAQTGWARDRRHHGRPIRLGVLVGHALPGRRCRRGRRRGPGRWG